MEDIVFPGGKKTLLSVGLWKQKQCSLINDCAAGADEVETGDRLSTGEQRVLYGWEDAISISQSLGPACLQDCSK